MKALTYFLPVDFIAHMGDVGYEGNPGTQDNLQATADEILSYLREAGHETIPVLVAIGNHDAGHYMNAENKN
jgi:hypothetical protein